MLEWMFFSRDRCGLLHSGLQLFCGRGICSGQRAGDAANAAARGLGRPGSCRLPSACKHNIDEFLPAVQFGVTLASLALGWIGELAVAEVIQRGLHQVSWLPGGQREHVLIYAHGLAIVIAFATITYFEVLLGELVPKSLALQRAERIAIAVAGPIDVFIRMTRPAVKLMNGSAALVLRAFRAPLRGEGAAHSPEELKLMATATRKVGLLPPFQEEMIHRAIELNHVVTREIMTPRGKTSSSLPGGLRCSNTPVRASWRNSTRASPSTIPPAGPENIIGVVYSKDILPPHALPQRRAGYGQQRGIWPAIALQVMRDVLSRPRDEAGGRPRCRSSSERRRQIAVVVDEFGSTVGVVTAEDALRADRWRAPRRV